MLSGVLCTAGVVRSTGFAAGPPAVESLVSDLDPHRDDNNSRTVELRAEYSSVSQGASWYRDEFNAIGAGDRVRETSGKKKNSDEFLFFLFKILVRNAF